MTPSHHVGKNAVGVFSRGILRIPFLGCLLDQEVVNMNSGAAAGIAAIAGWGRKPTALQAIDYAADKHLPYLALEDGFLRSYSTGEHVPPLSVVVDTQGIYYDSTRPSSLETLLNSGKSLLAGIEAEVGRAKALILTHRLSKYNHAPMPERDLLRPDDVERILVVDQTAGDMSVTLGNANADTFSAMLAAARREHPRATIYVKTHPEVTDGRKRGYLTDVQDDERTVVIRHAVNPLHLIEKMDRVYVVSSTMGFEALLAGKLVSVFGRPWYAGWGPTDDRQSCPRRFHKRHVDELFAAAYFHYTRYLDPVTHQRGTIFDVIEWLVRQRETTERLFSITGAGRRVGVGFRRWKAANIGPIVSTDPRQVRFAPNLSALSEGSIKAGDCLFHWGAPSPDLHDLATMHWARALCMEDGFVRSVGLGSDLIRPLSLVFDRRGIYFDPSRPSDLEYLLNTTEFGTAELARAKAVREYIVTHGVTKYNMEPRERAAWPSAGRVVVLVPGQVEDDASIRLGCTSIKSNLDLLRAARAAQPNAFIVYKPHPDVASGNRAGKLAISAARQFADHVETRLSVVSCIEACDAVHTMTSLTGFDALLRGKQVTTYGQPFYAGWGLTDDRATGGAFTRRQRTLTLDALVAGALLRYPIYFDWDLKGYTTCEATLRQIVRTRNALESSGGLEKLRAGFVRRQWRKLRILACAWAGRT